MDCTTIAGFLCATAKVAWDIFSKWEEKKSCILPTRRAISSVRYSPTVPEGKKGAIIRRWKLIGPTGEYVAMIRAKKKMWYIKHGLAVEVSLRKRIVKLNTEIELNNPAMSHIVKKYCFACSVSGEHTSLFEYHIIPKIYKKELPKHLTETLAHDVAQLCVICKEKMNRIKKNRRLELCRIFRLEIHNIAHPATGKIFEVKHQRLMQLGKAAKMLLSSNLVMSQEIQEKRDFLCLYLRIKKEDLCKSVLVNTVNICRDIGKIGHGLAVVSHLESVEDIIEFITDWRLCFAAGLIPDHLDPLWIESATQALRDHFLKQTIEPSKS